MKCTNCLGRGFIELHHGLVMVKCPECKGTGEIDLEEDTNVTDDTTRTVDTGAVEPDKPARGKATRKSTRTGKRAKSRKA